MHFYRFKTGLGPVSTVVKNEKLLVISLPGTPVGLTKRLAERLTGGTEFESAASLNVAVEEQLLAYLNSKLKRFDLPLELTGTPLQIKTLKAVAQIPYGSTKSYRQIAEIIGHPKAARAVGTTMARNPMPLIIPCHRVLASNGLGGYGGGLPMKIMLLRMEGALLPQTELLK